MAIADLSVACDRLAESTACPVVLEDRDYRVLTYSAVPGQAEDPARSAAILRRRTPEAWLRSVSESGYAESIDNGDFHRVADPWPGLRRRGIKALRHQGEVVGYLWLLEGDSGFPEDIEDAIERFSGNVLRYMVAETTLESSREESMQVRRVVEGSGSPRGFADFLGISPQSEVFVTCYLLPDDGFTPLSEVASVMDAVRSRGRTEKVALIGPRIARVEAAGRRNSRHVQTSLRHSAQQLQRITRGPVFAVSSQRTPLASVPWCWKRAALGTQALRRRSRTGRYATLDEVQVAILLDLAGQVVADHRDLFEELVEPLASSEQSKDLAITLKAALREGSVSRTAAQLQLHPNSVRYRLRKVEQRLRLKLDDPDARLALQLATWHPDDLATPGRAL